MGIGCGSASHASLTQNTLTSIAVSPGTGAAPAGEKQQFKATANYSNGTTADVTSSAAWSSSSASIATISAGGLADAVAPGTATVTASLSGVTGSAQFMVDAKAITNIAVAPSTASVPAGASQQFTATATYSDGSTGDVTSTVTWASSSTSAATISAAGLASGMAIGSTTVTASVGSVGATAALTVTAKALVALSISPAAVNVTAGLTQQLTATGGYSDGSTSPISSVVTWSVANASIATISPGGLITGIAPGTTAITATLNGMSATAALTVTTKTVTSLAVSPTTASIADGLTQQFTAIATYSDSSTANVTTTATWTSNTATLATVSASGLATGVATGSTAVAASLNGISATAMLTVTAKTVTSIAVSSNTPSIADGLTQQFTATAIYSDNSTANVTAMATWTTSSAHLVEISPTGLATGVAPGTVTVTASLNGVSGTAVFTVTAKTVASITVSSNTSSIANGLTQQFTATATYSDNSTANVTSTVTWSTLSASVATINSSGLLTSDGQGTTTVTATLGGVSGSANFTVTAPALKSIKISPSSASIVYGSTQQFTATAGYTDGSTTDVSATAAWSVANTAVATIDSNGLATAVAVGSTKATAMLNGVSASAAITVTAPGSTGVNIPTWHGDTLRSGLNDNEQSLTTANVNSQTFGKLFTYSVNGYAYAQPLLMSGVTINGAVHNVLYVATETNDVYAFDADNSGAGGGLLWHKSLNQSGETPDNVGSTSSIYPTIGITGTPVIDPATNIMYVVSKHTPSKGATFFRLSALDITTGNQALGGPVVISASIPTTETSEFPTGFQTLTTSCIQRTALLEAYGNIYFGFGSCHSGWMLAYDAQTLLQTGIFNSSPNLDGEGTWASAGGVWMGGGGPASNGDGYVYMTTGNGPWDGQTAFSDSILQFVPPTLSSSSPTTMQPASYFTPQDYQYMDCSDGDLASGGLLLIPNSNMALAGAKTARMYLVNTANLGGMQANDTGAFDTLLFESDLSPSFSKTCTDTTSSFGTLSHKIQASSYEIYSTAAYFNGSVYQGITAEAANIPAGLRQFTLSGNTLTPSTYTAYGNDQQIRGTTPFISANGNSDGVVWMLDQNEPLGASGYSPGIAVLRAFDPNNLGAPELYDSNMNSSDAPGYGIKFTSPIVANGKVYIATGTTLETATSQTGEIDVYGLN